MSKDTLDRIAIGLLLFPFVLVAFDVIVQRFLLPLGELLAGL